MGELATTDIKATVQEPSGTFWSLIDQSFSASCFVPIKELRQRIILRPRAWE